MASSRSRPRWAVRDADHPNVNHGDFDVARQRVVLQPVVTQQQVAFRVGFEQGSASGCAITTHHNRQCRVTGNQHRFVAYLIGVAVGVNHGRLGGAATITTADNARMVAQLAQPPGKMDGERGFAGAANADVANHHHRYGQVVLSAYAEFERLPAQGSDAAEQRAEWR